MLFRAVIISMIDIIFMLSFMLFLKQWCIFGQKPDWKLCWEHLLLNHKWSKVERT